MKFDMLAAIDKLETRFGEYSPVLQVHSALGIKAFSIKLCVGGKVVGIEKLLTPELMTETNERWAAMMLNEMFDESIKALECQLKKVEA